MKRINLLKSTIKAYCKQIIDKQNESPNNKFKPILQQWSNLQNNKLTNNNF